MTIPSYSSKRSGIGSSLTCLSNTWCVPAAHARYIGLRWERLAARRHGRLLDLEVQVFFHDLPGVAAGARRHRIGRVRGHAHLVEPRDRRAVVRELGEWPLLAQLAGNLARPVDRPVAQVLPLAREVP